MDAQSRERLRRNLDIANEEALVALANRGLFRRAQKDLESLHSLQVEETDNALLVRSDSWCVTMPPDGPAAAKDDSTATGITRFVLAASIYLREHWYPDGKASPEKIDEPSTEQQSQTAATVDEGKIAPSLQAAIDVLLAATAEDLARHTGKGVYLEALNKLPFIESVNVSYSPTLTVDFPSQSVKVVLLTDTPDTKLKRLLAQFKCTAPKSETSLWILQAIFELKKRAGIDLKSIERNEQDISQAIQQDRLRVARRTLSLLQSVVISGIAHPSRKSIERFETASVAAEAARFPRLARTLSSIAGDIQLQIDRSAKADPSRMIDRVLLAYAFAKGAANGAVSGNQDIYGRPRTQYAAAGNLELIGMGAYGWKADSGYEGVTSIFWEPEHERFLTASLARGENQDRGFTRERAYQSGLGWNKGKIIEIMCRDRFTLVGAKVNSEGRLSLSSECSVEELSPVPMSPDALGDCVVKDWSDAIAIAKQTQPLGLRIPAANSNMILLRPTQWGNRWFDELQQDFVWDLYDEQNEMLRLRIPWSEVDENSIAFLESIKVDRDNVWGVLGRIFVTKSSVSVYPISLLSSGTVRGDRVLSPQFDRERIDSRNLTLLDRLRKKFGRVQKVEARIVEDEDSTIDTSWQYLPACVRNLFSDLEPALQGSMESGVGRLALITPDQLDAARSLTDSLGLQLISNALDSLGEARRFKSPAAILANRVLHLTYLLRLAKQSAALAMIH